MRYNPDAVRNSTSNGPCTLPSYHLTDMDAADTATFRISVSGGTKVIYIATNNITSRCSGALVC